jgi:hypothetical protein
LTKQIRTATTNKQQRPSNLKRNKIEAGFNFHIIFSLFYFSVPLLKLPNFFPRLRLCKAVGIIVKRGPIIPIRLCQQSVLLSKCVKKNNMMMTMNRSNRRCVHKSSDSWTRTFKTKRLDNQCNKTNNLNLFVRLTMYIITFSQGFFQGFPFLDFLRCLLLMT